MMYPIMIVLAVALEIHPYSVMVAAAVSASCAFMLPVATPPNAVVFGSGYLRIPDMAKAGLLLNIIGTIIITIAVYYLLPLVWGIDRSEERRVGKECSTWQGREHSYKHREN